MKIIIKIKCVCECTSVRPTSSRAHNLNTLPLPHLQNDDKVKEVIAKSRGQPRRRLQHIYDLAKTKHTCEGGDTMDKKFDPLTMEGEEAMKVVCVCVECERGIRDKLCTRVCVLKM